jgi:nucleoside-diphosphate-sugar epimerase
MVADAGSAYDRPRMTAARRVFLAGATGVIGIRLVPLLVAAGHAVAGMTRSPAKLDALRALGAEPVLCDVYDAEALATAVAAFAPDTVMHQLTDLPDDAARVTQFAAANARIRTEGTRNLLAAARAAGASRLIAQSVAWALPGQGGVARAEHERLVLEAGGVVLRYGRFYGPGTFFGETPPDPPRIHIDEASRRTPAALDAEPGVFVVTEDEAWAIAS